MGGCAERRTSPRSHPARFGRAFAIGVTLKIGAVLVEGFCGWRTGSLALVADAAHNLIDEAGALYVWRAWSWIDPA